MTKPKSGKRKPAAPAVPPEELDRLQRLLREEKASGEKRERELLLALLSLLDGFVRLELATSGESLGEEGKRVQERFSLVRRRLERQLEREGVTRIDSSGEFDAERAEAVEIRTVENVPAGIVVSVEEEGYLLRGNLLRPAKVVVSG